MNLQVEAEVERSCAHLQTCKSTMPTSEPGLGNLRGKRQSEEEGPSPLTKAEGRARSFLLRDLVSACTLGSSVIV